MTNTIGMARLITLFTTLAVATALPAGAQETPPPQVEFLEAGPTVVDQRSEAESIEQYLDRETLGEPLNADDLAMWDGCPAAPESTGTWLRRGYWSAEIDAVVMIRKWDISNLVLATDSTPTLRRLAVARTSPSEASARLRLSRFLFRDEKNRDHRIDFSVMGGGEFSQSCNTESNDPNSLDVLFTIDDGADVSFDGSSSMGINYTSRLNTFEANYVVTSRMQRDRMELQPNGQWIRKASPGMTFHGLAGMRYTEVSEGILWTATDIVNVTPVATFTGENGQYKLSTTNNMFGFQAGGGATYETDRWNVTFFSRGGIMMNDAIANSSLSYSDPVTGASRTDVGYNSSARDGTLPLLIQGGILGRYHLRPNVSLRAGYEFLYVTAVALAPHQLNFTPDTGKVGTTGNPFYHGITMGMEYFW